MNERAFTIRVHHEDGSMWAEVPEVPGCFASGDSYDELIEGVTEALSMCLGEDLTLERVEPATDTVEEHRILLHA